MLLARSPVPHTRLLLEGSHLKVQHHLAACSAVWLALLIINMPLAVAFKQPCLPWVASNLCYPGTAVTLATHLHTRSLEVYYFECHIAQSASTLLSKQQCPVRLAHWQLVADGQLQLSPLAKPSMLKPSGS